MKPPPLANVGSFLVFFGVALLEGVRGADWLLVALLLAMAVTSLWADFRGWRKHKPPHA